MRAYLMTVLIIAAPVVIFMIYEALRKGRKGALERTPYVVLGLIGIGLAVAALIATAVWESHEDRGNYVPPIINSAD